MIVLRRSKKCPFQCGLKNVLQEIFISMFCSILLLDHWGMLSTSMHRPSDFGPLKAFDRDSHFATFKTFFNVTKGFDSIIRQFNYSQ